MELLALQVIVLPSFFCLSKDLQFSQRVPVCCMNFFDVSVALSSVVTWHATSAHLSNRTTSLDQHNTDLYCRSYLRRSPTDMFTSPNCTLTAKQQSALLVLWPCLKAPPRIDIQIGPEGIRLGATFDSTAPGMVFETVRSEHDQITVAANLDVATVRVDFEKLKTAAGLASAEEAAEVWESIRHLVSSASAATVAQRSENALEAGEKIPPWDSNKSRPSLVQQLYTAA